MSDYIKEKKSLAEYLRRKNIAYDKNKKTYRCFNHDDQDPSAVIYENNDGDVLWCPVCSESWNIFAVCSHLTGIPNDKENFAELLKSVRQDIGIMHEEKKPQPKKEKEEPVFLERDAAKKIYVRNRITELQKLSKKSKLDKSKTEIKNSWPYLTADNKVMALDVRFEDGTGQKEIITFWYNGKSLKFAQSPILVYGLDRVSNKPILIHEGSKCADIGQENLTDFDNISWSGGSGKVGQIDWTFLKDKNVYILYDNDLPGRKAAKTILKQLPDAKPIKPPTDGKGDDIEQYLEKLSIDELTEYILNPDNIDLFDDGPSNQPHDTQSSNGAPPPERPVDGSSSEGSILPFTILGIGNDNKAAFITSAGRMCKWDLESLSKTKLMLLADHNYWQMYYPKGKDSVNWDDALNDVMRLSEVKDHNDENIRGRGAWRDDDKISYHDGKKTYGEWAENKIYLRLNQIDIGITHEPASAELRKEVRDIALQLSFETPADAVRCLAWSVLAPFAGALIYRPSMLLTGDSGSGKTEVQKRIMRPISLCEWVDTRVTTTAGIRGKIAKNATSVIFDEAGKENDRMKANFEDILSYIRSNYSADSPDGIKGTKDGGYVNYKMNSMFALASTDPTIENIQDENRILRINFVKPEMSATEWQQHEKNLKRLLCPENCHKIRSYTWTQLHNINDLTYRIVGIARSKSNRDYRSSYAEMLLAAAFMIVWSGAENPTDEQIERMLDKYYQYQPADEHRSEAEEIVSRIMDETIEVIYEHGREKLSIHECLHRISTKSKPGDDYLSDKEIDTLQQHVSRHGIRLIDDNIIALCNNHHLIKKIIGYSSGYSKILKRHRNLIENNRPVYFMDGKVRKCSTLKDILDLRKADEIQGNIFDVEFE